ncbi:hypothetical protein ACIA5G_44105 [Amycolatopsis sp. NPDC051758]
MDLLVLPAGGVPAGETTAPRPRDHTPRVFAGARARGTFAGS